MKIEVPNGEIIDKLTIIEIKLENIKDSKKREYLEKEYDVLLAASSSIIKTDHPLYAEMLDINRKLWDIEDRLRDLEREKNFGDEFVQLARSVYYTNDKRCDTKRKINELTDSNLFEVKSYQAY